MKDRCLEESDIFEIKSWNPFFGSVRSYDRFLSSYRKKRQIGLESFLIMSRREKLENSRKKNNNGIEKVGEIVVGKRRVR